MLLSGTSTYNEILRSCLPPAEEQTRGSRQRRRRAAAGGPVDAEAGLQQPLLPGEADAADGGQQEKGRRAGGPSVHFAAAADAPPSRPITAARQAGAGGGSRGRYTMARQASVCLPAREPACPALLSGPGAVWAFWSSPK